MENIKRLNHGRVRNLEFCSFMRVVENFDRYMVAYRNGKNIPFHHFEFLQRRYARALFEKLSSSESVLMKYIDFLLNPYLKEIDLHHSNLNFEDFMYFLKYPYIKSKLHRCNLTDIVPIVERLKVVGEAITHLSLFICSNSTSVLLELTTLIPNIESLELRSVYVTDEVLESIAKNCQALQKLDVALCSRVTDTGLKALCENGRTTSDNKKLDLVSLDIRKTSVSKIGLLSILDSFPNLKVLRHDSVPSILYSMYIDDYLKNSLSNVKYNLEELNVKFNIPTMSERNGLNLFAVICPHISKLCLPKFCTKLLLNACTKFLELKEVYFYNRLLFGIPQIDFTPFIAVRGENLTILDIYGGRISVEPLLKYSSKLQILRLRNVTLTLTEEFQSENSTYNLSCLNEFSVKDVNFGNEVVSQSVDCILASAPNLERILFISTNDFSGYITSLIKHNCMLTLRYLDITLSKLSFPFAKEILLAAPSIESFTIILCGITEIEYVALKNFTHHVEITWRAEL